MDLLTEAIVLNDLEQVRRLLNIISLPTIHDYSDYDLLCQSIMLCYKDLSLLLIEKGFRLNKIYCSNDYDYTPLHIAILKNYPEIVKALLDKGASVHGQTKGKIITPVRLAFTLFLYDYNREQIVDLLLPFLEYDKVSNNSLSHLHMVCMKNHINIVKKLIQLGAPINCTTNLLLEYYEGFTPLHFAVKFNNFETVKLLLDSGADITVKSMSELTPLHIAFLYENQELCDLLLASHIYIDINPTDSQGLSHFHIACARNNTKIVENFLLCKEDVNLKIPLSADYWPGYTPLHFAMKYKSKDVIQLLLAYDADTKVIDSSNMLSIRNFDNTEINNLFQNKSNNANMSKVSDKKLLSFYLTYMQDTDIMSAPISILVMIHKLKDQEKSIDTPIDLDSPIWPGYTALHIAVQKNNIEMVSLLLLNGSKITVKDARGLTPLHLAFKSNQMDIVNTMLSEPIDLTENPMDSEGLSHFHIYCTKISNESKEYGFSYLHIKMLKDSRDNSSNINIISNFLKNNPTCINSCVDINSVFWPGYTPLHFAVKYQAIEVIQELLKSHYGADITIKNGIGHTPFDIAMENFRTSETCKNMDIYSRIIKLFIYEKINRGIKHFDTKGISLLHIACMRGDKKNVKGLLENCNNINQSIDQNSPFYPGFTPLHFAVNFQHLDIVNLLLDQGADVNCIDSKGSTPMHLLFAVLVEPSVIDHEDSVISKWFYTLLEAGAEINARDIMGNTPACIAFRGNFEPSVAEMIIKSGGNLYIANIEGINAIHALMSNSFLAKCRKKLAYWYVTILRHFKILKIIGIAISRADQKLLIDLQSMCANDDEMQLVDIIFDGGIEYEKESMKKIKINNYYSLFDILTLNKEKMSHLVKNDNFRKIIDSCNVDSEFYFFGYLLKLQNRKGLIRRYLLDESIKLFNIFTDSQLPDDCLEIILQNFNNYELRNFLKSGNISFKIKSILSDSLSTNLYS